jgi:hypothetical protein
LLGGEYRVGLPFLCDVIAVEDVIRNSMNFDSGETLWLHAERQTAATSGVVSDPKVPRSRKRSMGRVPVPRRTSRESQTDFVPMAGLLFVGAFLWFKIARVARTATLMTFALWR